MKKIFVIVLVMLALCASVALAQGENNSSAGEPDSSVIVTAPEPLPSPPAASQTKKSPGVSREDIERNSQEITGLRQQLRQLMAERSVLPAKSRVFSQKSAKITALSQKIVSLNKKVAWIEQNPLGGTKGQHAMWTEIHNAGVRSQNDTIARCDQRYVRRTSPLVNATGVTPAQAGGNQESSVPTGNRNEPATPAGGNEMLPWIILGIVVAALAVGATVWITITVVHNHRVLPAYLDGTRRAETLPNIPADAYQEGSHTVYSNNGVFSRKWHTN